MQPNTCPNKTEALCSEGKTWKRRGQALRWRQREAQMVPRGPPRTHDELGGRGTQLLSQAPRRLGWKGRDASSPSTKHGPVRSALQGIAHPDSRVLSALPPVVSFLQCGSAAVLCHFNQGTRNMRDEDFPSA